MDIIDIKWWLMERKVELIEKRSKPYMRSKVTEKCFTNGEIEIVDELLEMLKDVNIRRETEDGSNKSDSD